MSTIPARRLRRLGVLLVVGTALTGCETLNPFAEEEDPPLPGERISVLQLEQRLVADPRLAALDVSLPQPQINPNWPQAGGLPDHAMHHLSLGDDPFEVWAVDIGQGSSSDQRLLAQPVVADGKVFTMDADAEVRAFNIENGARIWEREVLPEDEDEADLGGGLAVEGGRLFVTTGAAEVVALDAESGDEIWRRPVGAPMRAAPSVDQGRVFAVTVDNELFAIDAEGGRVLWTHQGLPEVASILGGATPAADAGVVVVAHSSGEIHALQADDGRPLWSDSLAAVRRINQVATLSHIRGHPVIDRGVVFAVSHSGRMAALDLRSGARLWEVEIGAIQTPWVSGDFVYLLTIDGTLACLLRSNGRVRWAIDLEVFVDEDDLDETIVWTGPLLASDRLIIAGSHGEALSVSPYTGAVIGWLPLPEGVTIPPVVADNTLYLLDEDGELAAMR